jgi:hypothetical protein
MKKELFNELSNILMSAIALMYDNDVNEFYHRTCAIEMNEELTDEQIDLLETIKHDIVKLARECE